MSNISLTYKGLAVVVVGMILAHAGISVSDTDLTTTISTIIQVIGAIVVWYGRYRQGDISPLGVKKA